MLGLLLLLKYVPKEPIDCPLLGPLRVAREITLPYSRFLVGQM